MSKITAWQYVCTLSKKEMRSVKDPITKLHAHLLAASPDSKDITDFGMGKAGMNYFEEQIEKALINKYGYSKESKRLASSVAMTMLQTSPCNVPGADGFEIYIRVQI